MLNKENNKDKQRVPESGVKYFIKVNGDVITFDHQYVTGKDILAASKHDTENNCLYKKIGNEKKPVGLDETVDLAEPGIEKFRVLPKKLTDGKGERPPLPITEDDWGFLNSLSYQWEISKWQNNLLLKIKGWRLPPGYNVDVVDVIIIIPPTYPSAQLDMFYFQPALSRLDGKAIHALAEEVFHNERWQRWSRHRAAGSEWKTGVDDISTHLTLMQLCLENELGR